MHPAAIVWTGDAVIHLRVAELFAQGRGFEFNIGERVVATTSTLWTLLESALFRLFDPFAVVWIMKMINLVLWFLTVFLTATVWGRAYRSRMIGAVVAALFAFNPGAFSNSVNGMEAPLLAALQLSLFGIVLVWDQRAMRLLPVFLLSMAIALTRPEGVIFCVLLGIFLLLRKRSVPWVGGATLAGAATGLALVLLLDQHFGGTLIPDSSTARVAAALRESTWIGPLHIHSRSIARFLAYLPVSAGLLVAFLRAMRRNSDRPELRTSEDSALNSAAAFALLLTGTMLIFYTFVVGAMHMSRYWIPFFPFAMGVSAGTLVELFRKQVARTERRAISVALAAACIAWMIGIYAVEWRERAKTGFGYDHHLVAGAVRNRIRFTDEYLRTLGERRESSIRVAVSEVQVRYFLADDVPIRILSLDGRTAGSFARFVDWRTGMRRLDRYLTEMRPDFVELGPCHPAEPILPEVARRIMQGETEIEVQGFRFRRTGSPQLVQYLHE